MSAITPPLALMPGHLIRRLNQQSSAIFMAEMRQAGEDLTAVQYAALVALRAHPGIDQAGLALKIAADRATTGAVLRRLEDRGLIERPRQTQDRRARHLYLTAAGSDLLGRLAPLVAQVQETILRALSPPERQLFQELSIKILSDD